MKIEDVLNMPPMKLWAYLAYITGNMSQRGAVPSPSHVPRPVHQTVAAKPKRTTVQLSTSNPAEAMMHAKRLIGTA